MAYGKGGNKDIQAKTLLEVSRETNENRGTTTIIRVVDWISGTKHYPQLEKREFFADGDTGELKTGKAKGFTRKDLEKVQDAWGEIMAALGNRLPEAQAGPAKATPPADASSTNPMAAALGAESDF